MQSIDENFFWRLSERTDLARFRNSPPHYNGFMKLTRECRNTALRQKVLSSRVNSFPNRRGILSSSANRVTLNFNNRDEWINAYGVIGRFFRRDVESDLVLSGDDVRDTVAFVGDGTEPATGGDKTQLLFGAQVFRLVFALIQGRLQRFIA